MKNKIVFLFLFPNLNTFANTSDEYKPTSKEQAEVFFQDYIKNLHNFNQCFKMLDLLTDDKTQEMPEEIKIVLLKTIQTYNCWNHFSFQKNPAILSDNAATRAMIHGIKKIHDNYRNEAERELAQNMNKTSAQEIDDLKNRITKEEKARKIAADNDFVAQIKHLIMNSIK